MVIAACVLAAALAVVGVVLLAGVDFPPGWGGVPLIALVGVLYLVKLLMAIAHHRRTLLRARKQATNN
ncbi:MAG: hypothetical protein ACRDHJ_00485 [Actinomycetota bacterium]